jgi:hypothetical protein
VHTVRIETALYDDVELVYQDDSVAGSYLSTPSSRVTFVRTGPQTAERTPLGTRRSTDIRATVGGDPIAVQLGSARVMKRSYRVRLAYRDRVVVLAAKDLESSALIRGDRDNGNDSFGDLTREYDGGVSAFWGLPFTFLRAKLEPPTPTADEVLVGMTAAAAFGTGGLSVTTIAMSALSSVLP